MRPQDTMSPQDTGTVPAGRPAAAFDPLTALDDLLSTVSLARAATSGAVSIAGQDPILPAAHRLGACIGIPIMANAVAAVAFHRHRGGPEQDLELDLRQAIHGINPGAFWHPALNGVPAPHPLVLDNPFLLTPYRTADGRWVMASGIYPHLAARWCRFLDVPPDAAKVAAAIQRRDASELEETANTAGLPACVIREPLEWLAHPQGALLASQPVIGIERIGDAPARDFGPAQRPFDGIRVLSFTHAVAGPVVGRTLAEHGADVLCATRPNDYEHEFIYAEANLGSRSAYVDLGNPAGQERAAGLLAGTDIVVSNHRSGSLERRGLEPHQLAERHPGLVYVSVTCYGSRPVGAARRLRHERIRRLRPHDHGRKRGRAQASRHRHDQRLHHRPPGSSRRLRRPGQARHRGRLLAHHRQPHPDRHVVRVARPGQPRPGRLRRRAHSPRAGPLQRPQPARRRPHARPAGPVLRHRASLASTASCPPRLRPR
jgi:crotonobetainyl-CoA:carnitine CoA-transferase CaiB-like acyl-CoA transferase